MDDFSLWVICRQVSQSWRAEAERTFAKIRLCKLSITTIALKRFETDTGEKRYGCKTYFRPLLRLDADGTQAVWQVKFLDKMPSLQDSTESHIPDSLRRKALINSDLDYKQRLLDRSAYAQEFSLAPYCNDIPLPGVRFNIEQREVSFDWKAFMNEFFGPYAHAQHLAGTYKDCETEASEHLRPILSSSGSWDTSFWSYKHENFVQAYVARLQRRHEKAGLEFDLKPEMPEAIGGKPSLGDHFRQHIYRIWHRHRKMLLVAFRHN